MNYCYYIFGLRLPFGLRFDLQSHPPNRLIKFLFIGSRTLLHRTYSESDHLGDWICGIPNSDEHRHAAGKHSAGYGDYDCNLPDRWKICFIKSE